MSYDVVTFGEVMLRLSPPDFMRFEQTHSYNAHAGGAEMNVAVACARLGLQSAYVTKLGDNSIGHFIRNKAREHGVDTSHILWDPDSRCGVYFVEFGAAPRTNRVIYDRKDSAISKIKPGEVKWSEIFSGTKLFHTSGITPALSQSCAEATNEALRVAKEQGCKVSYDVNYRGKLWTPEEAREFTEPASEFIDILITTEEDTRVVYGIEGKDYEDVASKLVDKFGFEVVVITLRETPSVWKNKWSVFAYSDGKVYRSPVYDVEVVDRLGGGDSCSAGFIYGYLKLGDIQKAVEFGSAFSAIKHSVPGDLAFVYKEEVEKLIKGRERGLRIDR
ncbi:MAG: sugar kinase [Candidatus Thorarchaeota archaeon]|nr:MAG: sugar kinase [Candidatus Thorarchaeota archaeon]RLI59532.1 MAG: sugar kinase [Candidatus Thorarchaeota archaeon]